MVNKSLVDALFAAPVPRPDDIARPIARKLFPLWQAALVGAPLMVIVGATLAVGFAVAVATVLHPRGRSPEPGWMSWMISASALLGAAAGVALIGYWLYRRRQSFVELARSGLLVPAVERGTRGLGHVVGNTVGRTAVQLALPHGIGRTIAQVYAAPVMGAELDGEIIEVRTPIDSKGGYRVASHILVHRTRRYVALIDGEGWIASQRVLRRLRAEPVTAPAA